MTRQLIATLVPPPGGSSSWRWELGICDSPATTFGEPQGDPRRGTTPNESEAFSCVPLERFFPADLLALIAEVDRTLERSVLGFTVRGRYEVVERLLHLTWTTAVEPLAVAIEPGIESLVLVVPAKMLRIPFGPSLSQRSGESLIHMLPSHVRLNRPTANRAADRRTGPPSILRLDGHFHEIEDQVATERFEPGSTLLLFGCRTAEIVPALSGGGAILVLATLWDVDDGHCSEMANRVSEGLDCGLALQEALRTAQASLSHEAPFTWAGYVIVDLGHSEFLADYSPMGADLLEPVGA